MKDNFVTSRLLNTLGLLYVLIALNGCVSVSIGPGKPQSARNVKYVAPPPPYISFSSEEIDAGWKNTKAGASISYKSSCGDALDLPLEGLQQSMLYGIDNVRVIKSTRITYNEREALNSTVEGKVDGVDTKMELMILKKNKCTYMISFVSLMKSFDSELKIYHEFLKKFEAP